MYVYLYKMFRVMLAEVLGFIDNNSLVLVEGLGYFDNKFYLTVFTVG